MIAWLFVLACFGGMAIAGCVCQWLDSRVAQVNFLAPWTKRSPGQIGGGR